MTVHDDESSGQGEDTWCSRDPMKALTCSSRFSGVGTWLLLHVNAMRAGLEMATHALVLRGPVFHHPSRILPRHGCVSYEIFPLSERRC